MKVCSIITALMLFCLSAHAKENVSWINLGVGLGIGQDNEAHLNSEISYNHQLKNNKLLTTRIIYTQSFLPIENNIEYRITDIGMLYGPILKRENYYTSVSGGISYLNITKKDFLLFPSRQKELLITKHTVGLPLEAQLFFTPTKYFGIGLVAAANLNTVQSFCGILLAAQISFN